MGEEGSQATLRCDHRHLPHANGRCVPVQEKRTTWEGLLSQRQCWAGASLEGASPCLLPFFFIISAMSTIMLSVSSQNGDKWRLSCGVLRGHLLFISMMGKMPWLIKKNSGLPTANT